ncbi:cell division protein FtsQ [Actinopolyspora mzabensis]|uniref:Cell division protein FtsQ n=1 Tax=Actinopolyspora mzabensis TaxID=995066 RepID=A0A1G8YWV1_ACTMZ|nr:cell division protein FtsQ [Actinopolyspora mzabensis]
MADSGTTRTRQRGRAASRARRGRAAGTESSGVGVRGWITLGSLALLTIGAVVLFFTPVLGVRSVRIEGTRVLDSSRVRQVAAIERGTPMVRVDRSGVRRRLNGISRIDSATVRLSLPATVVIGVEERRAVMYTGTSKGFRLVDDEGVGFATVTERPSELPELRLGSEQRTKRVRMAAVTAVTALDGKTLDQVRVVRVETGTGAPRVRMSLPRGRAVEWGGPGESERKAAILPVLLTRAGEVYDVTSPELPTVS